MGTTYPEIFAALAAPFEPHEVKQRKGGGGRQLTYITARTAMNRLDTVLGPENWWDEYYESCDVLFCRLTVRLPDGSTVTKSGSGGFKQMVERGRNGETVVDEENTDKTGESDAFKRAAVKFGVGRYLYQDGVPIFEAKTGKPRNGTAPVPYPDWVRVAAERLGINAYQLNNHFYKWAIEQGFLPSVPDTTKVSNRDKFAALEDVFQVEREAFRAEARAYKAEIDAELEATEAGARG